MEKKFRDKFQKRRTATAAPACKTYHVGSIFIATIMFITIFLVMHMDRMSKYSDIVNSAKEYSSEIRELERQKKILYSEIEAYSSPRRSLEVGMELGNLKPRNENKNDIIYIEVDSN